MGRVLPEINGIEPEELLDRYVWVDEDGAQVSPVHRELRSAIMFATAWHERWKRLIARHGEPRDTDDYRFQKNHIPMTRSGKPPAALKRLHIAIELVDATDEEKTIAKAVLNS